MLIYYNSSERAVRHSVPHSPHGIHVVALLSWYLSVLPSAIEKSLMKTNHISLVEPVWQHWIDRDRYASGYINADCRLAAKDHDVLSWNHDRNKIDKREEKFTASQHNFQDSYSEPFEVMTTGLFYLVLNDVGVNLHVKIY